MAEFISFQNNPITMDLELDVREWLARARDDLIAARALISKKLFDLAAFHSQQSVEKSLKAVYVRRFRKLRKTHDVVLLGKEVGMPEGLQALCADVDAFCTASRYPGTRRQVSEADAKHALEIARKVLEWSEENS